MTLRLKCFTNIPKQRYFFDGEWGEALWFYGTYEIKNPMLGCVRSDAPFTIGGLKPEFEEWARDFLTGKWMVADSFRVAFREPGDLALAYLSFL